MTTCRKKPRSGIGVAGCAMSSIRPNIIWAMDFQFDTAANGTRKMLNVIDEFTREALAIEVDRSIDADGVVDVSDCLALMHRPRQEAVSTMAPRSSRTLRSTSADSTSTGSLFIDSPSPWQNARIESFNGASVTNC
jgi:putative transposase